jgi:hypothetical protein
MEQKIKSTNDIDSLKDEADRLRLQSGMFNSVFVVSNDAVVLATSPESLDLVGTRLNSSASKLAIEEETIHIFTVQISYWEFDYFVVTSYL